MAITKEHSPAARTSVDTARPPNARNKIRTLAQLSELSREVRADGGRVVMAHGVFDLLHMGHLRHLEEARQLGERLIVTVTPDRYVNKGPGRPVFTEFVRAEMVAALDCVDWVGINTTPSADPAIALIQPDCYVKGPDYADADADVTGKISEEKRAVESYGGRLVITNDVTFSSSELINRHLNRFTPKVRSFLDTLANDESRGNIADMLDRVAGMRVLVVGDLIIDEYRYVTPMSKTPKEHLIATLYQSSELFAGGVVATANHVAGICKEVEVLTVAGGRDDFLDFVEQNKKPNVALNALSREGGPTTRKCRYVDVNYLRKLFEVYDMDDSPLSPALEQELNARIRRIAKDFDVVIVNDFGHGMIMPATVDALASSARFLAINTQTNSANFGFNVISKYPRANYICIDGAEARLAARLQHADTAELVEELSHIIDCPNFVVTQASQGALAWARGESVSIVPAFADAVLDTVGAGDAFLAITAPLVATGGSLREIAFVGNVAGALKVGIVGHRQSIDRVSLVKAITALLK